jgi:hypothetical protein
MEVKLQSFLTSALDGDGWSDSPSGRFTSGELAADTHCIAGTVDSRAGVGALKKRYISYSSRESNDHSSDFQPLA